MWNHVRFSFEVDLCCKVLIQHITFYSCNEILFDSLNPEAKQPLNLRRLSCNQKTIIITITNRIVQKKCINNMHATSHRVTT